MKRKIPPLSNGVIVRDARPPDAVAWLRALLANGQPHLLSEIIHEARLIGITRAEVFSAVKKVDCLVDRWATGGTFVWMPPTPQK